MGTQDPSSQNKRKVWVEVCQKNGYPTRRDARKAVQTLRVERGYKKLGVYYCEIHKSWHIGRMPSEILLKEVKRKRKDYFNARKAQPKKEVTPYARNKRVWQGDRD